MKVNLITLGKFGGVFLVLGASLVIGYLAPGIFQRDSRLQYLLLALLALLPALVLLQYPDLGLIALIPGGLIISFAIGTGTQSSINISVIMIAGLVGLWAFDLFIRKKGSFPPPSRILVAVIVFFVISFISFGFGQIHWYPTAAASIRTQIGGLAIFLLSGFALLLVGYRIQKLDTLKWMVFPFIIIGFLILVAISFPALRIPTSLFQAGSTGSVFWIWLVTMSASQAIFNHNLSLPWRIGSGFIAGYAITYLFTPRLVGWTSGWLPSLLAIGILFLLVRPKWSPYIIILGGIIAIFAYQNIETVLYAGDNPYSLVTREAAWQILGRIVQVNPLFGLGFANYYWYTPLFPIMGYFVNFNSHNNYVDIIAQTGLIGLLSVFWIFIEVALIGWDARRRTGDGFLQAYINGTLAGTAATIACGMLGDWFLPFVYNIGLTGFRASIIAWVFMGGLVAISNHLLQQRDGTHAAA